MGEDLQKGKFAIKVTPEFHDNKDQSEIWRSINEIRNLKRFSKNDFYGAKFEFNKIKYCAVQRKFNRTVNLQG